MQTQGPGRTRVTGPLLVNRQDVVTIVRLEVGHWRYSRDEKADLCDVRAVLSNDVDVVLVAKVEYRQGERERLMSDIVEETTSRAARAAQDAASRIQRRVLDRRSAALAGVRAALQKRYGNLPESIPMAEAADEEEVA